tara:strand:+ start:1162 stop:2337 length:1176 start_codon:yes stop_codon:yes gene_type:complete
MRLILVILIFTSSVSFSQNWLTVKANSGDNRILLLKKYSISDECSKNKFLELNVLKSEDFLIKGKSYKLPIKVYKYNGKSIRSTIGIANYSQAKSIQVWNEKIAKTSIKTKVYSSGGKLWVPQYLIDCYSEAEPQLNKVNGPDVISSKTVTHEIFGEKYKNVKIASNKLKGRVYYLVSGHGGPDPGAVGTCRGKSICEDEYAYDITLRLGRKLVEQGATVYIIVRDNNDGIRDVSLLKCDKDEVTYPKKKIPLNQVKRLNQRADAINVLYRKHKKQGVKYQRMIIMHIDSRNTGSRVDMFFYYYAKSKTGKKVARTMYSTVKSKYDKYQKGRGYKGTVKPRNLHMLREALPTGVYIELGNIQNSKDQKRFTVVDNRDAVAKWFAEALMKKP